MLLLLLVHVKAWQILDTLQFDWTWYTIESIIFVGKSFLFIQNTLEAYQDGVDPNIALIRINDATENQKYVLYYTMKTEQRENPEVNLLIVGGKSSQDICKLKIIFGYFLLFGRMVLSVIDSYYTCSMYSTMIHTSWAKHNIHHTSLSLRFLNNDKVVVFFRFFRSCGMTLLLYIYLTLYQP